ncbi:class I adenylate-forming enzyme family protein [Desulfotomaculum copahuensis]|uniref:O-succinylbenzoate--CoA ligase n=1 Tax=Desulfotomaculum copahuensis TaxID=1838280 RepID=A0A1B7LEV7_9FIRM|nr:long-chain-fatty-acid--CoA ligase [Desulfotomaculum copahuensis]OAT81825.1 o-succinylbenzoate--CoA ligase [Desulfotomaculum copahuensis]
MTLARQLAEIGRTYPQGEALVYQDNKITYAELNDQVNRLASGLKTLGIKPEDRILLALGNSPEFVASFFAIIRCRCVAIPVNPEYTIHELSVIVADAAPVAVVCTPQNASIFMQLTEEQSRPLKIIVTRSTHMEPPLYDYHSLLAAPAGNDCPPGQPDEVVEILYTTGNTGSPKGVMLTRQNLLSNALTFARVCRLDCDDRSLLVAPVFHPAAQTCILLATLFSGGTVVIRDGWEGARTLLETIEKERITFFFGPPTMYALMLNVSDAARYNLAAWRIALSGGAALSPQLFHAFEQKFGLQITEAYGLTETSPVVSINPLDGMKKPGSIGRALPGVEVKVFDYEDRELPPGQVGEIVVRGPNVMKGYLHQEEENRWIMRNGWFHTGDLAYMDDEGYLFIVDRKKNVIIRGGLNIDPREVEEVLYTHPRVFDVAVIGVPDAVMGEEVMAFVLLRDGSSTVEPGELQRYCAQRLAEYKIPKRIQFVDDLPKTTSGKLFKRELKRMLVNYYEHNNNAPS